MNKKTLKIFESIFSYVIVGLVSFVLLATVSTIAYKNSLWQDLLDRSYESFKEYKDDENKGKGVQVWLDKELKNKLDRLKASGVELPVKHLLSAAVRVFLEDNEKQVNEQLMK